MSMSTDDPGSTGVVRGLRQIRRMILEGELLPGQKVHQGELATRLNMSRIPVREALSTLKAEGVLVHRPNTGFTVARFSGEDLTEIYLMRRLLEEPLMRSIDLSLIDADEVASIDDALSLISAFDEPDEYQRINHQFHFYFFDRSPLTLVREEVDRLWYKSNFYRSLYLNEVDAAHVNEDHHRMIAAVRAGDIDALIAVADEHRNTTEEMLRARLGPRRRVTASPINEP